MENNSSIERGRNIPELRFSEFDGVSNYNKFIFDDIFLFSTGKNIKQKEASPDFEIPCVRYGELYHMYNEVITEVINKTNLDQSELTFSNGDEILLPSAGEDPLDIGSASALTLSNVAIGRTINILKPKKDNLYSQIYVSYYINQQLRKKISTLAKGVSISNVYNSDLKKLTIVLPTPTEQTKIATFLTTIDKRITLLEKKKIELEQYKKGVMQKLFSQTLRFKKEDGSDFPDWEVKKLGEVCEVQGGFAFKSSNFKNAGIPIIRISNISNTNNFIDISNMVFYDEIENAENYTIHKGDLLIAMSGATTGKTSIYNLDEFSYVNQRVGLFKSISIKLFYPFITQYVLSFGFEKQLSLLLVAGAQPNISSNDIESIKIPFPNKEEQQKIANFLSSIDKSIDNIANQIDNSVVFKRGLLQKMFV